MPSSGAYKLHMVLHIHVFISTSATFTPVEILSSVIISALPLRDNERLNVRGVKNLKLIIKKACPVRPRQKHKILKNIPSPSLPAERGTQGERLGSDF